MTLNSRIACVWVFVLAVLIPCATDMADEPAASSPKFVYAWGKEGTAHGEFEFPIGITVDPHDHVWVASINGRIQQFDTNGKLLGGLQAGQGTEPGKFLAPHTVAFNSMGEFFVVDAFNHRIQKFSTRSME